MCVEVHFRDCKKQNNILYTTHSESKPIILESSAVWLNGMLQWQLVSRSQGPVSSSCPHGNGAFFYHPVDLLPSTCLPATTLCAVDDVIT